MRRYLVFVALAGAIPALVLSALVMLRYVAAERQNADTRLLEQARTLALAVDRELETAEAALRTLTVLPSFKARDWQRFHAQATEAARAFGDGATVAVVHNGQLLLSTGRPYSETPRPAEGAALLAAQAGSTVVSDLFTGPAAGRQLFGVGIAVPDGITGAAPHGLSLVTDLTRLTTLLEAQRLPDWVQSGIIDAKGVILARSRDADRFVGAAAARELLEARAVREEGVIENVTRDGIPAVVAFASVPGTGWTVRVGADRNVLAEPLRQNLVLLGLTSMALLIVALIAAVSMSRRIAAPIQALAHAARSVGRAAPPDLDAAGALEETAEVALALGQASAELRESATRRLENERLSRAAAAADAASQAKSAFLAHVSHEVRTPLSGVIGLADLMLREDLPATVRQHLTLQRSTALALQELLDNILDFTKIDLGRVTLESVPFDPACLVAEAVDLFRPAAEAKGVRVSLVAGGLPRRIRGDPQRLRQILHNVISNAVKFTQKGTIDVHVGPDAEGDRLMFRVRDTGIGFSTHERERLFVDFAQATPVTARQYGGSGLGLAISRGLVRSMGGEIDATSAPGEGTTVMFSIRYLPVRADEADAPVPPTGNARRLRRPVPLRVLVVEDHPVMRELVQAMLAARGHHPVAVANGRDALAALDTHEVDVILMDLRMPEMDGHATLAAIRAGHPLRAALPVIAVSAAAEEARGLADGSKFDAVLEKPIDWDVLEDVMATVTGRIAHDDLIHPQVMRDMRARLGEDAGKRLAAEFVLSLNALVKEARECLARGDEAALGEALHTLAGLAATFGCTGITSAVRATRDAPPDERLQRVLAAVTEVIPSLGRATADTAQG